MVVVVGVVVKGTLLKLMMLQCMMKYCGAGSKKKEKVRIYCIIELKRR